MAGGNETSSQALRVFVSYRRDATSGYAGRLYDRLVERFGDDRLFMDRTAIRPGTDFAAVIDRALAQCDVLLAVVGKEWLTSSDRTGRRRLDNPDDFVRLELEAALRRGVIVIPVLVQGAEMPSSDELPESLAGFPRLQAFELSDRRWSTEVAELITELERLEEEKVAASRSVRERPAFRPPPPVEPPTKQLPVTPSPARRSFATPRARLIAALCAALVLIAGAVAVLNRNSTTPSQLVPDVKGKSSAEAENELRASKFTPVVDRRFSDQPVDRVISQTPVLSRLKEGAKVSLVVSQGPEIEMVPDLWKLTVQEAENALLNAGFKPGTVVRRDDPQTAPGRVLDWSHRGTRQPKGTGIDLTISSGTPPPQPLTRPLALGPIDAGRYVTNSFEPKITFTVKAGWVVDETGPDRVVLSPAGRPTHRVSLVRVHRVYNPGSPNTDQRELATTNDALNAVQDVRELSNGLAAFIQGHPRRVPGLGGVSPITRAGRTGTQVDGQFRPYDYQGCETATNKCVPLFQLSHEPGKTFSLALVGSEVARFEVFDVVVGAKLVVVTSAPEAEFRQFVAEASNMLSLDQIEFTERISTPLLRSAKNPSNEGEPVTIVAEVPRQCSAGRVVFTNLLRTGREPLGTANVVNGEASVTPSFFGRGDFARVIAEHEGSDCARGLSAPLFQRVQ